jgi:hypothetical protein
MGGSPSTWVNEDDAVAEQSAAPAADAAAPDAAVDDITTHLANVSLATPQETNPLYKVQYGMCIHIYIYI